MRLTRLTVFSAAVQFAHSTEPAEDFGVVFLDQPLEAQFMVADGPQHNQALGALDTLMGKRQICDTGYAYCKSFDRCCPVNDRCCSAGYCLEPGKTCCPNGPCEPGWVCCGYSHCRPQGAVCCGDESWCEAGNQCYKVPGYTRDVCCTDPSCTAYVTGGSTVTRITATPIPTTVTTKYFYFIVTWTYTIYYWYYVIEIKGSVVTSSLVTTASSYGVRATDYVAASLSFDQISATLPHYTPAEATSLKSLAGSTKFDHSTESESLFASESETTTATTSFPRTTEPTISTSTTATDVSTSSIESSTPASTKKISSSTGATETTVSRTTTATLASSTGTGSSTQEGGRTSGANKVISFKHSLVVWFGVAAGTIGIFLTVL